MKTIICCCLLVCYLLSADAHGQSVQESITVIKKLEERERTAASLGDTTTLFALRSDDYVVTNTNNMILTAAQIKSYARSSGMDKSSFTRNIEKVSFTATIAVVMGSETATPKDKNGSDLKTVYRRFTHVWVNTATGWKLFARQVTNTLMQ